MGFIVVRQRGSHVFMQRGDSFVTVPLNNPVKKTTLNRLSQNPSKSINFHICT
jgi:predicted RNA binding protein YcfA (HicA-like mRNA interferase family)